MMIKRVEVPQIVQPSSTIGDVQWQYFKKKRTLLQPTQPPKPIHTKEENICVSWDRSWVRRQKLSSMVSYIVV